MNNYDKGTIVCVAISFMVIVLAPLPFLIATSKKDVVVVQDTYEYVINENKCINWYYTKDSTLPNNGICIEMEAR